MSEQPSLEIIELELALLIRRITSLSTYKKVGNLDRSAHLLLHRIAEHGSAGVKALAEEFGLDVSTVSRQTAVLEQNGYVTRVPDPTDGRAYTLQITESGARELAQSKEARIARLEQMLQNWSNEEREMFGKLMGKFNRTFI